MKLSLVPLSFLVAAAVAQDDDEPRGEQRPKVPPMLESVTSAGCYKSKGDWEDFTIPLFLSSGSCSDLCIEEEALISAMGEGLCWCGNTMPPKDDLVDDENCNHPCPGFPEEACGGIEDGVFWSVYNNGLRLVVPHEEAEESPTSTATSPTSTRGSTPSSATASGSAAASQGAQDDDEEEGDDEGDGEGGPNVAAIAAGVSVGVAVILGLLGFGFWFMRRRRNQSIEEEHRRNAAVNSFIAGAKPPGSSGGVSMTDSRMDPVLAHRRLSDGSIADNQDYSRKILRVTNA
ncbi:hypothetical protein SODALDRAFT_324431 [Sodiomyces alkalinus F11]|uniref:WSC domain-containing protein n=1 Tax=Sodiomyces alkalinus (strain CBS 110278 / VKM F-3762 / F11) TaxID=1314773 RepID=A0A3N2PU00_SODAK|nr:hypothetical protein SODALDRAFT_324431 [Sodiomyces alkalinus F11]ROT37972.1 hypothetical protein SODALDRAFT_324431 [Sodiomyces alkalinus F11]